MAENRELALVLKLVADQFQNELKKSGGMLGEFNKFVSDWKVQLLGAGSALFAIAKSTANYGEELLKSSQKIGVNIQALAGLQYAASLADVSHDQLSIGLKKLSQNMVEASRHTGDGEALFQRLGVSATDATGKLRPTEQVLLDLAEKFAQAKDGAGKTEAAVKLFGRAGFELVPLLNKGRDGITELMAEAERLGLVLSKEDAEAAHRFNEELKKLEAGIKGMTLAVGKELIPSILELVDLLKNMGVGAGLSAGLSFIHERFVGLNVLVKELKANAQFLFGTGENGMSFKQLQAQIAAIEGEGQRKVFEASHPGVLTPKAGAATDGKQELAQLADQQKLAKAKIEIFQEQQRAIDIFNKLAAEDPGGEAFRHLTEFRIQEEKNEEDRQTHLGQVIVEQTSLEVQIRDAARHEEQQGLIDNAQAWVAYYDQLGGNSEDFLTHKTELLRAQLAKELDLTKAQSAELLAAWQQRDSLRADQILADSPKSGAQKDAIELNTMNQAIQNARAANGSFFEGWAKGMSDYVRQTGNGFNLATDMARQTAQAMQQGFQSFFFDLMDNKIKSLKDTFRSLLGFVKQMIATITSQLLTSSILKLVASGFGAGVGSGVGSGVAQPGLSNNFGNFGVGAAGGGQLVQRFAMGGPVSGFGTGDTVPALLTPGEFVLSRADVADVKRGLSGGSPINIAITVNAQSGRQQSGTGAAPNFTQLARDLSRLVEAKLLEEQRPGGLLASGAG